MATNWLVSCAASPQFFRGWPLLAPAPLGKGSETPGALSKGGMSDSAH